MSELTSARLAEIAAGSRPSADETRRIAASPALRRALAAHDPSALFALLGGWDDDVADEAPAYPGIAALETSAGTAREDRAAATPRRRTLRAGLAACAAVAAVSALLIVGTPPEIEPSRVASASPSLVAAPPLDRGAAGGEIFGHEALPALVERVGSPTAEVVALIPPSAGGPVVSLIVDEEVGL
jgi:hypothetical protein